ncbi:lactonase family protein [Sinomonas halotolerans]|uniref:Beta-propeller fold lactonase family protein n=1 Tax=Sinomonas halotolerans TaxID=1644133 RepID=A0ABU9X2R7_9MICC
MTEPRTLLAIACPGAGAVDTLALDPTTGQLEPLATVDGLGGASALAFAPGGEARGASPGASPAGTTLYAACNEGRPRVVVLTVDGRGAGRVREDVPLPASSCFIVPDPAGRGLFSASYGEGRLDLVPVPGLSAGPARTFATGRNTHCAAVSPDGRFLYATALGDDRLSWFPAREALVESALEASPQADDGAAAPGGSVAAAPGSGPRYLRLNAAGDRAYVVHERTGEIAVYARDAGSGELELLERVSAVEGLGLEPGPVRSAETPDPGPGVVWAADLRLTPDCRFLYTTERSTGTVAAFAVGADGRLGYLSRTETEAQPCGAALDPSGRFLLVAGEGSSHVTAYRIGQDGSLAPVSRAATSAGPVWVEVRGGA